MPVTGLFSLINTSIEWSALPSRHLLTAYFYLLPSPRENGQESLT